MPWHEAPMDCVWPPARPPYRQGDGSIVVQRVRADGDELAPDGYAILWPGDPGYDALDRFLRSHGR